MTGVRVYRMTVASTWYDTGAGCAREFEMHFKVARSGDIGENRRQFAKRCVPIFQQYVYNRERRWPPKRRVKVGFEREQPAEKQEDLIQVETRSMEYRGKRHSAAPFPSRKLNYEKRKRVRKSA